MLHQAPVGKVVRWWMRRCAVAPEGRLRHRLGCVAGGGWEWLRRAGAPSRRAQARWRSTTLLMQSRAVPHESAQRGPLFHFERPCPSNRSRKRQSQAENRDASIRLAPPVGVTPDWQGAPRARALLRGSNHCAAVVVFQWLSLNDGGPRVYTRDRRRACPPAVSAIAEESRGSPESAALAAATAAPNLTSCRLLRAGVSNSG